MIKASKMNQLILILVFLLTSLIYAQNKNTIIGTVGKEHMVGNKLVICELGTQACMFFDLAPQLKIKVNNRYLQPQQLQVGWYVEVDTAKTDNGNYIIRNIKVDPTQTIFCFSELDEKQMKPLQSLLTTIKGIDSVKVFLQSKQVFVKYNPREVNYRQIESNLKQAGYKIE